MGYLGRRIGLSQDQGDSNPGAANGAVGGGLLDLIAHGYFERQGDIYNAPGVPATGLTATGGVVSDYTDGSVVYRAHIFTSTGTFDVTALGTGSPTAESVEYLVVGGGGGSSFGGGGAGGVKSNHPDMPSPRRGSAFPVSTSPGSYTVTIGSGGAVKTAGVDSVFGSITASGGGYGGGVAGNTGPVGLG